MDEDYPYVDDRMLTESTYQRDGSIARFHVYRFYLGKHGPFTERVPLDNFDPSEIQRRVDALRQHLRTLPR